MEDEVELLNFRYKDGGNVRERGKEREISRRFGVKVKKIRRNR